MRQGVRASVLIVSLAGLVGCAGMRQVELSPQPPGASASWLEGCVSGEAMSCEGAASTGARLRDRQATGQALVLGSAEAPEGARRSVAALGAWLNPTAWASDAARPNVPAGLEVPEVSVPAGSILVFQGAQAPRGGASVGVELAMPTGEGPWGGASLAPQVAAATGGAAAVWRAEGQDWLSPATPLLNVLLGMPLGPVPASMEGAVAWARELASADAALGRGEVSSALQSLRRGLALTPGDAPGCTVRGALHVLDWKLGGMALDGNGEALDGVEVACTGAGVSLPASEASAALYLRERVFLEAKASRSGNLQEQVEELYTPEQRAAWRKRLAELASGPLAGRRGATLLAMMDEVIASSEEASGPCDGEVFERRQASLEGVRGRYASLGRTDLVQGLMVGGLVDKERQLKVDALQAALDFAEQPEHRWVRQVFLSSSLTQAAFSTRPPASAPLVASLCNRSLEALQAEVEQDKGEGVARRNASRLFSVVGGVSACPESAPLQALTDRVLQSGLEGGGGQAEVLLTLTNAGFQLVGALLGGRSGDAVQSVGLVRDGLARVQARLGDGAPDRTLGAVLGVVVTGLDVAFRGQGELGPELRRARGVLDEVTASPPSANAPEILKLAPALHLGLIGLEGLWSWSVGDSAGVEGALKALDASLERDLKHLLAAYESSEHEESLTRLARGFQGILLAAGEERPDLAAVEAAAEKASSPGASEARWWRVGMELGRVVLWDIAGALASGAGEVARRDASRERAEAVLSRLVEGSLDEFGVRRTGWELLSLAPALHRTVLVSALDGEEDEAMLRALGRSLQGGLAEGLGRISPEIRSAPASELGFLAVVLDMLEVAQEVGPERLMESEAGRRAWAERWGAQASGYPAEYRFLADVLTGTMLFDKGKPEAGLARLEQASRFADAAKVAKVGYAPSLFRAALLVETPQRSKEALGALEGALGFAGEARSCGATHELEGALPVQALLLEQQGRHEEADAALERYLGLIRGGFSGDGRVQCEVVAYQPNFTMRFGLKQNVQAFFFGVNHEGDFSLSAGFESHSRDWSRMTCSGEVLGATRHDLELTAWLMRAVFALRAGRDKEAHLALLGANAVAYRLIYGSPLTLSGSQAAGLEESREKTYLKLMGWVAALGNAAGHVGPADNLKLVGAQLLKVREETWATALEGDAPPQLAGLGLEGVGPLAAAWLPLEGAEGLPAYEAALKGLAGRSVMVSPEVVPILVAKAHREVDPKGAAGAIKKLKAPRVDARAKRLHAMVKLLGELDASPASAPLEPMLQLVAELAGAGQFGDVAEFVARASNGLWSNQRLADTVTLTRKAIQAIPAAKAPRALGMMLLWLANLDASAVASDLDWARRMGQVSESLNGTIDAELELRVLFTAASGLAAAGRPEEMERPVALLRQLVERGLGPQNALTINVQIMELAVDAALGRIDLAEVRQIEAAAARQEDLEPSLKQLLERMVAVCGDPAACRELSAVYLQSFRR